MRDVPDPQEFDQKAKLLFDSLLVPLGYQFKGSVVKVNYVIQNYLLDAIRQVEISNETHHVDYGFLIFVRNLQKEQYNIFYNVPWEKQDRNCLFLQRAYEKISKEQTLADILAGRVWMQFQRIYFQE